MGEELLRIANVVNWKCCSSISKSNEACCVLRRSDSGPSLLCATEPAQSGAAHFVPLLQRELLISVEHFGAVFSFAGRLAPTGVSCWDTRRAWYLLDKCIQLGRVPRGRVFTMPRPAPQR